MQTSEKQRVIKAIGDLGRRVTAADVATKTGLPLLVVQQDLNQVAAETGGHLQVATTGDIAYTFNPGFSNAYIAKGIRGAFNAVLEKARAIFMYLLRISFGIILILSLLIIVVVIIIIIIAMQSQSNDRDRGDGGGLFDLGGGDGFHFSFWDWMILRDLLWWNSYSYSTPINYRYDQPTVRTRGKSNFLLNCFSFLFGDNDPNEGLGEKRWQVIAQVIKRHNNVLTAEQLAPYTGADPKDEDAVLPVLVRFNGRPEVTESGSIFYVFESMQSTTTDQFVNPPNFLQEFEWKFTNVPDSDMVPVYIVAFINFCGAWFLWYLTYIPHAAKLEAISGLGGLHVLVNCLVIYGTAFLAVPVIRAFILGKRNKAITDRNAKRHKYAQLLAKPTAELGKKLKEAVGYRVRTKRIEAKDVVFTTDEDARDQEDDLTQQFDQLESSKPGSAGSSTPGPEVRIEPAGNSLPKKNAAAAGPEADAGGVIEIRKKLERDFDASP